MPDHLTFSFRIFLWHLNLEKTQPPLHLPLPPHGNSCNYRGATSCPFLSSGPFSIHGFGCAALSAGHILHHLCKAQLPHFLCQFFMFPPPDCNWFSLEELPFPLTPNMVSNNMPHLPKGCGKNPANQTLSSGIWPLTVWHLNFQQQQNSWSRFIS